jgi:lipopolysaccharide export system protein LptA
MRVLGCLLAALLGVSPALATDPDPGTDRSSDRRVLPTQRVAIGVAPFEHAGAPGAGVPDVATLLAERLVTKGVERVVGPAELGARSVAEPGAGEVSGWASRHELGAIVVGRATRLGSSLSLDLRLRAGRDGRVVATYIEEVPRPSDLEASVERLAERVMQGAALAQPDRAAQPATAGDGAGGSRPAAPEERVFQSDAPIKISAAQLEAFEREGGRRVIFTDDVRASQGDLSLTAQRLEAFYPPGQSQPDRLVATGGVVVVQENKTARCDQATYHRDRQLVVCTGRNAVLTQDDDQVQGQEITFHLDTRTLTVKGNAQLRIQPERRAERDGDEPAGLSGGPR